MILWTDLCTYGCLTFHTPQMSRVLGRGGGCRAKSAPCGCLNELQRPLRSSPLFKLNVAGSLTSVKPTTTVSVCSLGRLQRQAQIRSIARSILLPDLNFACDEKKKKKWRQKINHQSLRWFMYFSNTGWETSKGVARGDSSLSLYFVYQVDSNVAYCFI